MLVDPVDGRDYGLLRTVDLDTGEVQTVVSVRVPCADNSDGGIAVDGNGNIIVVCAN